MIRIGVDFGGTKIEAAAMDAAGVVVARERVATPRDYEASLQAVADLVKTIERIAGPASTVGVGMPGSLSPRTGLIRNANSTWLNGRNLGADLERSLDRPVRLANDANCMALSEAVDGAGAGASGVVFGAILGTGCGGGVAIGGRLIEGANGVAGEWGHTPLPSPSAQDKSPPCWCGRAGCLETYISGSGFEADYARLTGRKRSAPLIVEDARRGDRWATQTLERYVERLGRALAVIVNILDPEVIVLAGGMSNVAELYDRLPAAITPHVFSDVWQARIARAAHGDSSGVRGAAWLWPQESLLAERRETAPA